VRTVRYLVPLALAAVLWGASSTPARALTVEGLVKLRDSGCGDEVLIKMVKTQGIDFEASVENIKKLKEKKFSDKVLVAIIEAAAANKGKVIKVPVEPVEAPPEPAKVPPDPKPKEGPDFKKKPQPVNKPEPRKKCHQCGGVGLLPCPRHKHTDFVVASTMKAVPACCRGVGWVQCPTCRDAGTKARVEERRKELAARVLEWERADKAAAGRLFHGETRHIALDTDLAPREAAKVAAHCENLLAKLRRLFKNDEFGFTRPKSMRVVCIGRVDTFVKMVGWFGPYAGLKPQQRLRLAQSDGMTIYGGSGYSLCVRERTGRDYMNFIINGYGHVLVSHVWGYKGRMPAWINEGFGSFCETLELGKPGVWNFDYDAKDIDARGDWKQVVRKAVRTGKTVPLETLMGKTLTDMKALDYQQSWSVTNALIYGGPDKYQKFLKGVKNRQDQTEALEKAYGVKIKQIELVWKNYAARQK